MVGGPTGKFTDIPPGSFWVDVSVVDRMLKQNDSYAVADVEGFKRRRINADDWIVNAQPLVRERKEFHAIYALAP